MSEKKCFCNFPIETRIDDVDLPNKIKEKLNMLDLHANPERAYSLAIYFDPAIYGDSKFYNFPVEQKHQQKGTPTVQDILSQQLNNICHAIAQFNINFQHTEIVGANFICDINRVDFCIIEDTAPEQKEKKVLSCSRIVPNMMSTLNRVEEVLKKFEKEHAEKEYKKTQEKSQHTSNMKSVDEIFIALATAILEDSSNKLTSPEKLSREMILQAQIKNDWPLEIRGSVNGFAKENCVVDVAQIDCPEFFVYVKNNGYWTLSKAATLEAAKTMILTQGYNYKDVEQVVVLHNLKNMRFKLFTENKGEIEPISKSKAHTAKRLLLRWIKSRK